MCLPQFLVIYDELIMNYILALLAVAVLSVFVLGRFKIIALVCLTVVRKAGWALLDRSCVATLHHDMLRNLLIPPLLILSRPAARAKHYVWSEQQRLSKCFETFTYPKIDSSMCVSDLETRFRSKMRSKGAGITLDEPAKEKMRCDESLLTMFKVEESFSSSAVARKPTQQ